MGNRELKRVPLDFNWPLNVIWKGYTNPFPAPKTCDGCHGTGYNPETLELFDSFFSWFRQLVQEEVDKLVQQDGLIPVTHQWTGEKWIPREGYHPTADEVNTTMRMMPFDYSRHLLTEVRAKRLGVLGSCSKCKGRGELKLPRKMKKRYNKWREYDPPYGPGYQLWETCTEGSPISPVFASLDELAKWCAEHETLSASSDKITSDQWLALLSDDRELHWQSTLVFSHQVPAEAY